MNYSITDLTLDEVNTILGSLGKQQYESVYLLINKIIAQVQNTSSDVEVVNTQDVPAETD